MALDWERLEEGVAQALAIDETSRAAWLADYCNGDNELHDEITSLLRGAGKAEDFFERPIGEAAALLTSSRPTDNAGKQFGKYKILGEIGRGGMGAVLLAERSDGEFDREVALKIINQTIPDSLSKSRFRRERQILASLDHPNIARLLDGGVTDLDEPFLVMEHISGAPLLKFAAALDLTQRLRLFLRICGAVSYAHRNLVIHRDIKPANILVTEDGEPKLLDFGLAKMLDLETDVNETATVFRALTPAYASPEQLRNDTVGTATDIYSLGVLLFELITGKRPFETHGNDLNRAIAVVLNEEPPRMSSVEANADLRNVFHTASNDLETIVQKALRKKPADRYPTVERFADDIRRYLDGLPITARPQTVSYRASKFIKRHRLGFAAALALFLIVVAGVATVLWQARQVQKEKERAETINRFLAEILNYTNPLRSRDHEGETKIIDALDALSARVDGDEFATQPELRAELKRILGDSYTAQGRYEIAWKHYLDEAELLSSTFGPAHHKTLEAKGLMAVVLFGRGKLGESEKLFRETLGPLRENLRNGKLKPETYAMMASNFGWLRRTQGDPAEAESAFREVISLVDSIPNEGYFYVGLSRATLASALADLGRFDEAVKIAEEGVAEYRRRGRMDSPDAGFAITVLGGFYTELERHAEADALLKEAEQLFAKKLSPEHLWLGDNLRNQGISLYFQGHFAEANTLLDRAKAIYLKSFGEDYDHYPTILIYQGLILAKTNRPAEGELLLKDAVRKRERILPAGHYWIAVAKSALGEFLTIQHRNDEAGPLLKESYRSLVALQGETNPRTLLAKRRLDAFMK